MSDNELGAFLRARRETVTPAEVGLPSNSRRRTPGLRRAELATLAGVSMDYLARLEQGRDRNPSPQVLGALADVLRLSSDERLHLLMLSKIGNGPLCAGATANVRTVRPTVQALLDRLEPSPAVLLNNLSDVLAFTGSYQRIAGPIGLLDDESPNVARFVFTDPRARTAYCDWEGVADQQVAHLKIESRRGHPHADHLTNNLTITAGASFTSRFEAPMNVPNATGTERINHPEAGELRLSYETLAVSDADGQRLVVYLPADDSTAAALDQLARRHSGALRAVE